MPKRRSDYGAVKERARARSAEVSESGRDIGPIPRIADPKRRAEASTCLRRFLEIYLPETFTLAWSSDHLKVIARLEEAASLGGLFAEAAPRGFGKTSLTEGAILWAVLTGRRRFPVALGSAKIAALAILDSLKVELEFNERLADDFPEVCYAIVKLEGIANRCAGQLCGGKPTHIQWTKDCIVLPSIPPKVLAKAKIPESNGCGAIIRVAGLTGAIKGMKHKQPDGKAVRPDFVLGDDPQTDKSAWSLSQCERREALLSGAVLGLAGPGKKICGVLLCTVIRPGDLADRILDRELHPDWQGERMKMLYAMPTHEKLWTKYAELRADNLRAGGRGEPATAFYSEHQVEMDAGAIVAWPERHNPDEISGLQHAMNLKIRDEAAFAAEYQNEPLITGSADVQFITADQVSEKTNGHPRGRVPLGCETLTAFVDVQAKILFYCVCAWTNDFTGYVIDYGTEPDQGRLYFRAEAAQRTLRRAHPGAGSDGAIYAGLEALAGSIAGREWTREDGAIIRPSLCLVDQGWKSDVVHQFCRQSAHAAVLMPSRGQGITASMKPMAEFAAGHGRVGQHWWIPVVKGRRVLRHVEIDTNYWKTFVHERLATAMGDKGCLSLFGKPGIHRLFADHVTAERRVPTEGRGRRLDEWKLPPQAPDNHWLDCLVGCAAAASIRGVQLHVSTDDQDVFARKRIRLSELQAKRGLRGHPARPVARSLQPVRQEEAATARPDPPGTRKRIRLSDMQRGAANRSDREPHRGKRAW
jgi:hypothetical protein